MTKQNKEKILVNIFNFIDWVAKKEVFASGKKIMTACLTSELIHAFGSGFGFSTDVKGHVQKKKQKDPTWVDVFQ